jgi:3-hydroxyisobutyrate dehydrogenase-like beta-hydroxyacid dehydrogenase
VGAATYVKVATNMISAAEIGVLSEALALLARGGVPLPRLMEALQHNVANSGAISAKLPLMLSGDFAPRFSTKNMLKDLQIALRSVEGKGIDLPVTSAAAGALMGAMQAGWGEDDFASIARHYAYAGSVKDLPDQSTLPSAPSKENKTVNKDSSQAEKKKLFGIFGGAKNS